MAKKNNLCAILAYLLVGIIWYFVDEKMKKDKFVKFHVKQAITLMIAWVIWSVAIGVLVRLAFFIIVPLLRLLSLVPWVFVVLGIINGHNSCQSKHAPNLSYANDSQSSSTYGTPCSILCLRPFIKLVHHGPRSSRSRLRWMAA